MTYRAYIKKDYKPEIRWVPDQPWYRRKAGLLTGITGGLLLLCGYTFYPVSEPAPLPLAQTQIALPEFPETSPGTSAIVNPGISDSPVAVIEADEADSQPAESLPWRSVEVKKGDNLSMIFDRLGLGPTLLYQIMSSGKETQLLKELMPGQKLDFLIENGNLLSLKFEPNLITTLMVVHESERYSSQVLITPLELRTNESSGAINSSLFLAGQRAGLSDNLIMQLVSIFGWDIDFALDIRKGDEFNVIYQEQFKDNIKVGEGPILAAEFVNRRHSFRAVRYTSPEGDSNYFNEKGISMRKAFLRTPLKFSRISSRFNLRRKHPVLNRIRAHRGVDYAAPTGTPIKATGDGKVILAARKGGYGRTVILKHGGARSTLYAHMSSYSKNIRKGKRVKQGQIIGYVGKSGLATGPHLHYEFQVNGVHRNPLTVKLPKATGVPKKHIANFRQQTAVLLAQLDNAGARKIALGSNNKADEKSVIALDDSKLATNSVH